VSVCGGPKRLIDKMDVAPGHQVNVIGIDDEVFLGQLAERTKNWSRGRRRRDCDVIVQRLKSVPTLVAELKTSLPYLAPTGMIWAVWPKGRRELTQTHVMVAAKEAGLVDVKVVSFSQELSGLKLVIRVADRAAHAAWLTSRSVSPRAQR
jgi:hypothetical protein